MLSGGGLVEVCCKYCLKEIFLPEEEEELCQEQKRGAEPQWQWGKGRMVAARLPDLRATRAAQMHLPCVHPRALLYL